MKVAVDNSTTETYLVGILFNSNGEKNDKN